MGLDWNYRGPSDVFNEMRKGMNSIAGITWERLERERLVTYPCENEGDPGEPVVFIDSSRPRPDGPDWCRADIIPAAEQPTGSSVRAHHRPPARALAHRRDHPQGVGARCDRTGTGGLSASARSR